MIDWIYFPLSDRPPQKVLDIVKVFEDYSEIIDSETHVEQESNIVLSKVRDGLINTGFQVEVGKKAVEKINVTVLFGKNGKIV